ncbi:hypothetical protein FO519_007998 [Halicephalobus sp. NKZ332]|nr:hypothetical protein FO519_007998 [Halicephalobus sp. NKZ332]
MVNVFVFIVMMQLFDLFSYEKIIFSVAAIIITSALLEASIIYAYRVRKTWFYLTYLIITGFATIALILGVVAAIVDSLANTSITPSKHFPALPFIAFIGIIISIYRWFLILKVKNYVDIQQSKKSNKNTEKVEQLV